MKKVIFKLLVLVAIIFAGNKYVLQPLIEVSSAGQESIIEEKTKKQNTYDQAFAK